MSKRRKRRNPVLSSPPFEKGGLGWISAPASIEFTSTSSRSERPELGEIASTLDGRDITRGYLTDAMQLPPSDPLLERFGGANRYDIYRQVLSDWQVRSTFQQRQLALTACEWTIDAGGTRRADQKAADFIREILAHVGFDDATQGMHFGVFYGFAVAELLYARDGQHIGLDAIKVRDRSRFAFLPSGALRLLTLQDSNLGEALPDRKFWTFQTGADHDDEPYGMGLAHWLYWLVQFKRGNMRFWLTAAEKFGTPTAVGWFPPGTSPADVQRLLAALKAIQIDAGVALPEGMRAELLEAKRTAGVDFERLCVYLDQAIAKVVLGQVMTSEAVGGQYKAEVQNDVRRELVKADADLLCESFNRGPVRWLTEWNFPGATPPRVFRQTEPADDLNGRAERERKVFDLGYRPTLKTVRETYGGEWEAVKASEPPPEIPPNPPLPKGGDKTDPSTEFAASNPPLTKGGGEAGGISDAVDPLIERLGREADPLLDALLDPVRAALAEAEDLMDFRDRLLTLYPELDARAFADLMGQALAAADAAGYFDSAAE